MRRLIRHFLLILSALALVSGSTVSFAASLTEAPCSHAQSHDDGDADHGPSKHHGGSCLTCCLGACLALPDLPQRSTLGVIGFSAAKVRYWEISASLPNRSIAPDLGPPRTGT